MKSWKRLLGRKSVAFSLGIATGGAWLAHGELLLAQAPPNRPDPSLIWARSASPLGSLPQRPPAVSEVVPAGATQVKEVGAPPTPTLTQLPTSPIVPQTPILPPPAKLPDQPTPVFRAVRKEIAPEPHLPPEGTLLKNSPLPIIPSLPISAEPALPAQPAKLSEPVQPMLPTAPQFNLRSGNDGNNLKTGMSVPVKAPQSDSPSLAWIPIPDQKVRTEPQPGASKVETKEAARTIDRQKLPEQKNATSEKYIFPVSSVSQMQSTAPKWSGIKEAKSTQLVSPTGVDAMTSKSTALAALIGGTIAITSPSQAPALFIPSNMLKPADKVAGSMLPKNSTVADEKGKTPEERLKEIEKQLTQIHEVLRGRKDETGVVLPSDPGIVTEVQRLKNEVALLKSQLETMQKSTSLKPSVAPAALGKGILRIVNDYPIEITIGINKDDTYRVAAGKIREIEVPAGEFSYFLLSSGVPTTPTKSQIKEKEVVTLRIK